MLWRLFAFAAVLWGSTVAPTAADVLIRIDKAMQQMTVASGGKTLHVWPVSTGRAGYVTPNGNFRPQWMARRWFSRRYHGSPMPYSIFYHKGYAIHGTTYLRQLGAPASHGCVRLHPSHAATLFALVQRRGMRGTRIVVTGANPAPAVRRREPPRRSRSLPRRPASAALPSGRQGYSYPPASGASVAYRPGASRSRRP